MKRVFVAWLICLVMATSMPMTVLADETLEEVIETEANEDKLGLISEDTNDLSSNDTENDISEKADIDASGTIINVQENETENISEDISDKENLLEEMPATIETINEIETSNNQIANTESENIAGKEEKLSKLDEPEDNTVYVENESLEDKSNKELEKIIEEGSNEKETITATIENTEVVVDEETKEETEEYDSNYYTDNISDISFDDYDVMWDKNYSFKGNSGKAAVIIFGGLSSCGNTMNFIVTMNSLVDKVDPSKLDVYFLDNQGNSAQSIKDEWAEDHCYEGFHFGKYNNVKMSELQYRIKYAAGLSIGSGYTMPLVGYKGTDGKIKVATTGYSSEEKIINNLKLIGIELDTASSSDEYTTLTVKYGQAEARGMLSNINNFRTGGQAWYWDSSDSNKVYNNNLSTLYYDYNLEEIAMLRAAEIAKEYSHTRPNGKRCFSAYDVAGYEYRASGENIAYGYTTAEEVFNAWKEDNEKYAGQGHRRNMLNDRFMVVGIGHCVYNGRHFWVQEFAFPSYYSSAAKPKFINDYSIYDGLADVKVYTKGVGTVSITKSQSVESLSGWKLENGRWRYYENGACVKNAWKAIGGVWYHFDANGYMQTGWLKDGNYWYYLESSGAMATNKWISGTYYVKSNGVMATNEWVDNGKYYVDGNGKWVPNKQKVTAGWKKDSVGWWYQNADGTYPRSTWKQISGVWYHFNASGYMQTGWLKDGNCWYYLESSGAMATNKWISGTYYVKSNGVMATNEWVDGGRYYVDGNGKWVPNKTR